MRLHFRFALREVLLRWQSTLVVVGAVALSVALVLVTMSMNEALTHARDEMVAPLLAANVDVVVSLLPTETPEVVPQHDTINTLMLYPAEPFTLDDARLSDLSPIDAAALQQLLDEPDVSSHASALVVTVEKFKGIAPPLIKIPERSVAPLSEAEAADVQSHLTRDTVYQQDAKELRVLCANTASRDATPEERDRAAYLVAELRDIELSYYPERFDGYAPGSFAVTSMEVTVTSITVAGLSDIEQSPLLGSADLVEGTIPASGTAQAVVSAEFADAEHIGIGETFSLLGSTHTVVGIAKPTIGLVDADVYLPIDAVFDLTGVRTPNLVVLGTQGPNAVPSLLEAARAIVPTARVFTPDNISLQLPAVLGNAQGALQRNLAAVIAVVVAGAIGIMAVTGLSAARARSADLGVLVALGWRRTHIVIQVLLEMLLRTAIGLMAGVVIALSVDALISRFSTPIAIQVLTQSGQLRDHLVHLAPAVPLSAAIEAIAAAIVLSLLANGLPLALLLRHSATSLLTTTDN